MSKQQGDLAELKFYLGAYERGLIVSKPFGDNSAYDFIVDNNGTLSRIQVKSSRRLDLSKPTPRYAVHLCHGANNRGRYTKEMIDFIAAYIIPCDAWYILPIKEVSQVNLSLYPHIEKGIGKYEKYREAWELF